MRLDRGGGITDPLLRSLVTLPTSSIGSSPPVEDDSGRRLDRKGSWKELSGRSLHRGDWGRLRGVPLECHAKGDGDSRATQDISESSLGSLSSTCLQSGPWPAEEPASELSAAKLPRRGVVSLSEERLERLASEEGGWLPTTAVQLVRTFPSPTRWLSTNPNPLVSVPPSLPPPPPAPRTPSRHKRSEHFLPQPRHRRRGARVSRWWRSTCRRTTLRCSSTTLSFAAAVATSSSPRRSVRPIGRCRPPYHPTGAPGPRLACSLALAVIGRRVRAAWPPARLWRRSHCRRSQ